MSELKFTGSSLYKTSYSVFFVKHGDGSYQVSVKPGHVLLQIGWGGVGCSNFEIYLETSTNNLVQKICNFVAGLHPFLALMLFDVSSAELKESFKQTHDNDAGASDKRAPDKPEVAYWEDKIQQMLVASPAFSWITRLVLNRAQQALSLVRV